MGGKEDCILSAIGENIGDLHITDLNALCSLLSMRGEVTELIALQWVPDIGSKDGRKRCDTSADTGYSP